MYLGWNEILTNNSLMRKIDTFRKLDELPFSRYKLVFNSLLISEYKCELIEFDSTNAYKWL